MEDWTKVLLYGTYDGFTRSTDGLHRIVVVLEGGERVEIPKEFVVSAEQMVNKNKIKLKDVIARIKSFDVESQKAWLNEILNELGSDYRALIYKDGYEQGKLEGLIKREIVTVPRFVADWIEYFKNCKGTLYGSTNPFSYYGRAILEDFEGDYEEVLRWIRDNSDTYARAWLDGYEVEKEKKYKVKFKNIQSGTRYLKYDGVIEKWYFGINQDSSAARLCHTKEELEKAGFGWVFDCEGIEIEEVEE